MNAMNATAPKITMRGGLSRRSAIALAFFSTVAGCAKHAELAATAVDSEYLQPQVDEAARSAARCLRRGSDRVVEIEARENGAAQGYVHPGPGTPEEEACVAAAVRAVRANPSDRVTRAMVSSDGKLLDPLGRRERGLALRARATQQRSAVERCRAGLALRRPTEVGRVGLRLTVDAEGRVKGSELMAATVDDEAAACVAKAAGGLRLPPIAGAYSYSYMFVAGTAGGGVLVGAPDADPVDPHDLAAALEALHGATDACMATLRPPVTLLLHLTLGNDGVPITATLERGADFDEDEGDRQAGACLLAAARALRVPFFDGPPAAVTVPFTLR